MLHMMQMLDGACLSIPQMFTEHLLHARVIAGWNGGVSPGEFTTVASWQLQESQPQFHFVIPRLCLNPTLKAAFEYL